MKGSSLAGRLATLTHWFFLSEKLDELEDPADEIDKDYESDIVV